MADTPNDQDRDQRRIQRRTMLKAAAVAGATAPLWSSPKVTAIGPTPRFAVVCTAGFTNFALGSRNTSCNCNGPGSLKFVNYKDLHTPCAGDGSALPPGFTAYLSNGPNGPAVGESGSCPADATNNDNAGVQVNAAPGQFCRTIVRIWDGGSCQNVIGEFPGPIIPAGGSGFFPLPAVECSSSANGGNIFISVILRCSSEQECL